MRLSYLFIAIFLCWLPSIETKAMSCPNGFVSTGLTTTDVHMKCGNPTFLDEWLKEHSIRTRDGFWHQHKVHIEEWTYNLGTNRLIQILRFRNGKLINIQSGGYGSGTTQKTVENRIPIISLGFRKTQVLRKWGQPTYATQRNQVHSYRSIDGSLIERTVQIEEWTYDFGPHRLVRFLVFKDGQLVANKTKGYGTKPTKNKI